MLPDSSTRLNKYISESGICSRREADRFIEQGNVFINGKRATIGDQVKAGDVVKVNGRLIEPREADDLVLIALNRQDRSAWTSSAGLKKSIICDPSRQSKLRSVILPGGRWPPPHTGGCRTPGPLGPPGIPHPEPPARRRSLCVRQPSAPALF